ncbi:MAG: zinc metallopeptidase [Rikenellaceae bacterium]|jgi:predicted metalloprotease|nr:zinc metallopeptidase [Rikenellaceae bacterium]
MKLTGRRRSSNVEDRRASGGGRMTKMGLGGLLVAGLITWLLGGNPLSVLQNADLGAIVGGEQTEYVPTEREEKLAEFASQILAGTEDVWSELFKEMGRTYQPPRMVLFNGAVQSGCGGATSSTGPFYCSADQTVYIDLSFFDQMESQLRAGGDFAYAYVIAHEVGHHVQYLLGILDQVQMQRNRVSQKEANRLTVRLELQADFFAGIWAHYDDKRFGSLEDGDIEEGLNAATSIGDDRLQMEAQGYTVPDSFTHGTSKQRMTWLKKGYQTGDLSRGDSFSMNYDDL